MNKSVFNIGIRVKIIALFVILVFASTSLVGIILFKITSANLEHQLRQRALSGVKTGTLLIKGDEFNRFLHTHNRKLYLAYQKHMNGIASAIEEVTVSVNEGASGVSEIAGQVDNITNETQTLHQVAENNSDNVLKMKQALKYFKMH